jgi:hypothetical protein
MDTTFFLTAAAIVIVALSFGEQEYRRKLLERRAAMRPVLARKSHGFVDRGAGRDVDASRHAYCSHRWTR